MHREEQERKLRKIVSEVTVNKTDKLLDVGCGTGIAMDFFDCEKIGIDPSKELLSKCKYPCVQGFAEKLPFEGNEFDIVICLSAIHNFKDPEKAIKEMKRVGKNKFIITVFKKAKEFEKLVKLVKDNFNIKQELIDEHDYILLT